MKFIPKAPRQGINVSPTHPLKEALYLVVAVSAGAAVIFAVVISIIDFAVVLIPPTVERDAFEKVWPHWQTLRPATYDKQPEHLQDVLDRLAQHWNDNPYALRVGVMENNDANAFALPGGFIMVTRGMLEEAESENEIAFVLAHEIGHFRNRDHLRSLGRGVAVGLLLASVGFTGAGASVPDLLELVGKSTVRSYDREQERAADRFGLELLEAEYGHVAGATAFFERLAKGEKGVGRRLTAFMSTHPVSKHRVKELIALATERGWSTDGEILPIWDINDASPDAGAEAP